MRPTESNSISDGGVVGDGKGQTIAIVDAYDDPNIVTDLHQFNVYFGLPDPPSFQKLNQSGQASPLPGTDPSGPGSEHSWEAEESLDVEWAHATAPGASIVLIETNYSLQDVSAQVDDLLAGVDTARSLPGVSVVSMSFGWTESI